MQAERIAPVDQAVEYLTRYGYNVDRVKLERIYADPLNRRLVDRSPVGWQRLVRWYVEAAGRTQRGVGQRL